MPLRMFDVGGGQIVPQVMKFMIYDLASTSKVFFSHPIHHDFKETLALLNDL